MTFTYDLAGDVGKVRWHIGDTDPDAPMLTDEEITSAVSMYGGVEGAVIGCLNSLLARMAKPDFEADWLKVNLSSGRAGIQQLLALKRQEFGLGAVNAKFVRTFRIDTDEADT